MDSTLLHKLAACFEVAGNALHDAAAIVEEMAGSEPPASVINTPSELDAALAVATPGAVLLIDASLRYLTPLAINVSVTLTNAYITQGRATRSTLMPRFSDGLTVNAPDVKLIGIEVQKLDPLTDIVVTNGANAFYDGCRVLGDPTLGAKRGIAGNAPNVTLINSYVDDCFQASPGNDSQAFAAWNSPGPFRLENNFLCGGSETVLFGGADPQDAAHIPSDITITGNTITKNPAWHAQNIGVKNTLELKNAINVLIEDNDIEYSWGGHGQDGYLLMLTPRNQDGGAPYSTVKHVTIRNNRLRHAAAAIAILGRDNPNVSETLEDVTIEDNEFVDIDPQVWTGTDKMIYIADGPKHVTIDGNKFKAQHIGSVVYLSGEPQAVDLKITGNTFPPSEYGVMGAGSAPGGINNEHGSAWTMFVQSGQLSGNIEQP